MPATHNKGVSENGWYMRHKDNWRDVASSIHTVDTDAALCRQQEGVQQSGDDTEMGMGPEGTRTLYLAQTRRREHTSHHRCVPKITYPLVFVIEPLATNSLYRNQTT